MTLTVLCPSFLHSSTQNTVSCGHVLAADVSERTRGSVFLASLWGILGGGCCGGKINKLTTWLFSHLSVCVAWKYKNKKKTFGISDKDVLGTD